MVAITVEASVDASRTGYAEAKAVKGVGENLTVDASRTGYAEAKIFVTALAIMSGGCKPHRLR